MSPLRIHAPHANQEAVCTHAAYEIGGEVPEMRKIDSLCQSICHCIGFSSFFLAILMFKHCRNPKITELYQMIFAQMKHQLVHSKLLNFSDLLKENQLRDDGNT